MGRFKVACAIGLLAGAWSSAIAAPSVREKSRYSRSTEGERRSAVLLNLDQVVSSDDYPPQASMADEQGTAAILVKVDEAGRVADCTIEQSSGSATLDTQTCRLFWLHARFTPARDEAGKPVVSVYSRKITWRLEGDFAPVAPWAMQLFMTFKGDAGVDCKFTVEGALQNRQKRQIEKMSCEDMFGELAVLKASQDSRGGQGSVLFGQRFTPGDHAATEARPTVAGQLLFWSVLQLKIDPEGKLTDCKQAKAEGKFPLGSPCESVPKTFMKPMDKAGTPMTMNATLVMTASAVVEKPSN